MLDWTNLTTDLTWDERRELEAFGRFLQHSNNANILRQDLLKMRADLMREQRVRKRLELRLEELSNLFPKEFLDLRTKGGRLP